MILSNHMRTIEHSIEQWAQEKLKTLSMTEQESVRIWNVIQSQFALQTTTVVIHEPTTAMAWVQSMMRWSLIPVAAMALLVVTTVVEENNDTTNNPQPLPIVSMNQKIEEEQPDIVVDVRIVQSSRRLTRKSALYAGRNQTVFVAWGESIFTPVVQASATQSEKVGNNVFSQL